MTDLQAKAKDGYKLRSQCHAPGCNRTATEVLSKELGQRTQCCSMCVDDFIAAGFRSVGTTQWAEDYTKDLHQ